jgi:hypothetical protein
MSSKHQNPEFISSLSTGPVAKDLPNVTVTPKNEESEKSFETFLSFVLSLSIFGASIFTTVVSEIANPNEINASARFARETVRSFLGIAWLLFVVALGAVSFSMSASAYIREHPTIEVKGGSKLKWELIASSLIQISVITAFLFLSLALVAYTEIVGWIAVGLTSTTAISIGGWLVIQWW